MRAHLNIDENGTQTTIIQDDEGKFGILVIEPFLSMRKIFTLVENVPQFRTLSLESAFEWLEEKCNCTV